MIKAPQKEQQKAWLASSDSEYAALNLKRGTVESWEDAMRTDGGKGNYEWWYFDAKLDNGATLVVGFYTKLLTDLQKGISPVIMVNVDYEDGSKIDKTLHYDASEWKASTEGCDVAIGKNYFRGNLEEYEIHFEDDELVLDIQVKRETVSWRPQTGHMYFGEGGDFFAWVVAVPQGHAKVTLTYKGATTTTEGSCYHDHNWGNKSLSEIINHWYWSRAELGAYTVIASEIIAAEAYGYSSLVVFNVSKDGKLVEDDGTKVILLRDFARPDDKTGNPVSEHVRFIWEDGGNSYEVRLDVEKHLMDIHVVQGPMRMLNKALTGDDPSYSRFTGSAAFKVTRDHVLTESLENDAAVWELMYFGA